LKNFESIIRKKGILKTVIYLLLIIVIVSPLIILRKQVTASLKGTCVATTYNELEQCRLEGRYTKIKTKNIYDVNYNYVVDERIVGKFLDIDLGGRVIIALADSKTASELLSKEGEKTISGYLISFENKAFKETLAKIKEDYAKKFVTEDGSFTTENAHNMFFSHMLNQYDGKNIPYIIPVIIVCILTILLLPRLLDGVKMIVVPTKYKGYGKLSLSQDENSNKADFEYQNGPYLFSNKHIKVTNNYIFDTKGLDFNYHKNNEAVWMYEETIKKYGLIETDKNLVIKFKDSFTLSLPLTLSERKKMMEIFRVKNKDIIKGYSKEAEENYKEIIKNIKKNIEM